jgi:hypothetical protein
MVLPKLYWPKNVQNFLTYAPRLDGISKAELFFEYNIIGDLKVSNIRRAKKD